MAKTRRKRSTEAIKRKYGSRCFETWGKRGGSPVLRAWKEKRAYKGYRVTKS